jgi:hypothetical protein
MPVADLSNAPASDQELAQWSFAHQDHHRNIIAFIQRTQNVVLPQYVVDPVDTGPNAAWGDLHQTMHNNSDVILGVSGYDVSEVDWKNPDQLASWIWLHYQLHYAEATASGVW